MFRRYHFIVARPLMFTVCAVFSLTAAADTICVFTNRQHPPTLGVRVIDLDAPMQLEAELSHQLPTDLAQATTIVQGRLKQGGNDLQRKLATAYEGVMEALRLRVSKIPAVVVDQRYVVYGETDIPSAVARIAAFREAQQ